MHSLLRRYRCGLFVALFAVRLGAAPPPDFKWETPPGWTETQGGAGGEVLRVTTLAASGPGSLAAALDAAGSRTIEFAVAGTIDLGGRSLRVAHPFVTIAGESAPSPGITLTNGGLSITTHDVIVRHVRVRPGAGQRPRKSGWAADGITTGRGAHDVIVDHCSISWATDENLTASGLPFNGATPAEWRRNTSHRITFSQNIVGEGLLNSTHVKGEHSMGTLLNDNTSDIAIVGNLYISNHDRHPLFKGGVRAAVINNLIHNPGLRAMQFGFVPSQWQGRELQRAALTIAGNVVRKGPSSAAHLVFLEVWPAYGPCDLYLHDNQFADAAGRALSPEPGFRDRAGRIVPFAPADGLRQVEKAPNWPPRLTARASAETAAWVLASAGARPWDRDPVDRRLVREARSGGGKIIDYESEVGGLTGAR